MATRTDELKIKITGDASQAQKTFNSLGSSLKNMGPQLAAAGKVIAIGAGLAAAAGVAAIAGVVKKALSNFIDNELIQTKLANTIKNTGVETGVTAQMVNKLADEMQRLTRFEDDNVSAAGEVLARYRTIGKETFPEVLSLSADLAESLGVDIVQAAEMMGKALVAPGEGMRVLKQAGVALTDQQQEMIDKLMTAGKTAEAQKLILDLLQQSIGGVAVAAGNTASGQLDKMKNTLDGVFDSLGEKMGPGFAKILSFLGTSLSQLISDPAFINFMTTLGVEFSKMADKLPMIVGKIREFFDSIGLDQTTVINGLTTGLQIMGMSLSIGLELFSRFVAAIGTAKQTVRDLWAILQMLGLYISMQLTKAFQAVMESAFIKGARALFAGIGSAIMSIVNAIKQVISWFAKLPASIPSWLIPGSPTPFEIGLRGISSELDNISKMKLPNLTGGVSLSTGGAGEAQTTEMANIRDEIRFLVRTLPKAIANANA